jgi:hypothetical protein
MRLESVLLSLIHLFSLIFFIGIGCMALSAAVSTPLRGQVEYLMQWAQQLLEPKTLAIVGFLFVSYGLILFVLLLLGYRKSFLRVSLKSSKVLIDRSIIQEYVSNYFKTLLPNENPPLEIIFHPKQKLEILTKLPEMGDKEILLKRIENELGVLLARKLGYKEEFILTLHEA